MSTNIQKYQQHQFAKHHYRKLLQAKTTIKQFRQTKKQTLPLSRTLTPLDRYEYKLTNDKIRNKLLDIYQQSAGKIKSLKRKKRKSSKSVNFSLKQQNRTLQDQNVKLYERLITAKSTIGDFKARQRECRQYSKITRKKSTQNTDSMYQAYKELLTESRTTCHKSSRSAYKRRPLTAAMSQSAKLRTSQNTVLDYV